MYLLFYAPFGDRELKEQRGLGTGPLLKKINQRRLAFCQASGKFSAKDSFLYVVEPVQESSVAGPSVDDRLYSFKHLKCGGGVKRFDDRILRTGRYGGRSLRS